MEAARKRLQDLGILPTEQQEASRREMQAGLRGLLDDIRRASMSMLITFSNPDILGKSAPDDASPLWLSAALQAIYAEIDRRFPVTETT
jgi:hypothetical protein